MDDLWQNNELKSLFLYCALLPEDYSIPNSQLLGHFTGEGLVVRLGSLKATRNKVDALIERSKIMCTLESGEGEGTIRMHDVLWITSPEPEEGPKFLVQADDSVTEAPEIDKGTFWLYQVGGASHLCNTSEEEDDGEGGGIRPRVIGELSRLNHLTSLHIWFFNITTPDRLTPLANSLQFLKLYHCEGVTRLPTRISDQLTVDGCKDLESVVARKEAKEDPFQCLQELQLHRLILVIYNRLKAVFTKAMALNSVERIRIYNCEGVEEVIEEGAESNDDVSFPKLRVMKLEVVSRLRSICSSGVLYSPELGMVNVWKCPQLRKEPPGVRNKRGLHVTDEDEES
ncbi:hypothetical protein AMTR_s00215p00020550 [Amborella trichopoda]|uniref:Uncharacterized protein n=1 Tax=Amborella trichopoda TaxID=13333 RepID=W1P4E3_AMBTC|nr:hypothetical protein AMTR_s00215p00020550 [Amborella trichopoda]